MDATTGPGPRGRDRRQVRIGDAERDEVLEALQEHLASGRLTVDEYEERAGRATAARFAEDLDDLLTDLPPTGAQQERRRAGAPPWQQWGPILPLPLPVLIGLGVLLIIALPGPPFLLFPLLWFGLFLAFVRHGGWRGPRAWVGPSGWRGAEPWDGSHGCDAPPGWSGPHDRYRHRRPGTDQHDDGSRVV